MNLENPWIFLVFMGTNFVVILLIARFVWPIWNKYDVVKKYEDVNRLYEESKQRIEILELRVRFLLDELRDASIEIGELEKKIEMLERSGLVKKKEVSEKLLLLAIGDGGDLGLSLDLTSFRALQTETGVEFKRILDCTPDKLKVALDRARLHDQDVYLNLSVHASAQGLYLGGILVDPVWLSSVLDGVQILLIAGCESDQIGDYLGVVPYVVTMSEKVQSSDAAIFVRVFWREIINGEAPDAALRRAIRRSPSSMGEYVVKHWD